MGEEQFTYKGKLQLSLDRLLDGELSIFLKKNQIIQECCENELELETQLKFCQDFQCKQYIDTPAAIIRNEEFFVEHSIITPGFERYFLSLIQPSLENIIPIVVDQKSEQGRLVLALRTNIAQFDVLLSVISRLENKNPQDRKLRKLTGQKDNFEYVKGVEYISIVKEEEMEDYQKENENRLALKRERILKAQQSDTRNQNIQKGILAISGILILTLLFVIVILCYKQRKIRTENNNNKEEENHDIQLV